MTDDTPSIETLTALHRKAQELLSQGNSLGVLSSVDLCLWLRMVHMSSRSTSSLHPVYTHTICDSSSKLHSSVWEGLTSPSLVPAHRFWSCVDVVVHVPLRPLLYMFN